MTVTIEKHGKVEAGKEEKEEGKEVRSWKDVVSPGPKLLGENVVSFDDSTEKQPWADQQDDDDLSDLSAMNEEGEDEEP